MVSGIWVNAERLDFDALLVHRLDPLRSDDERGELHLLIDQASARGYGNGRVRRSS